MAEFDANSAKKQGTRVFKKSSPNGKVTTYLCKRDFIDSLTECDPIEGVVLVDPDYVKDRKVFTHILAAFRYGREDLDVLGLTFRKDLYLASAQVYPCVYDDSFENGSEKVIMNPSTVIATGGSKEYSSTASTVPPGESLIGVSEAADQNPRPLTRLQERLTKKLGANAFPFYFKLPPDAPASVMLQPGPNENGKPCGVDYELRTYVAEASDDKLQKRNSVRLVIRKLTYAPEEPAPQPSAVVVKDFIMSPGSLRLEVSLDKEKYYHGESIAVNVLVDNNSNKTVKKIKLSIRQSTKICLHNTSHYNCVVCELETEESFPIMPSQTGWCKVYRLRPLLSNNRHKRGLALDGKLKHEDTNLASSTIIINSQQKENLGMIVQYRVKVRLVLGFGTSDVSLELPFTLTHPKPVNDSDDSILKVQDFDDQSPTIHSHQSPNRLSSTPDIANTVPEFGFSATDQSHVNLEPDRDLIALDTECPPCSSPISYTTLSSSFPNSQPPTMDDDDLIFEDFARLRLKACDQEAGQPGSIPSTVFGSGSGDVAP